MRADTPIPLGLCQCGCGRATTISKFSNRQYGYIKGQPRRYVRGHNGAEPNRIPPLQRFMAFVSKRPDGCWEWTGSRNRGYGQFNSGDGPVAAYRWYYEQVVGPVPKGLQLDHLCRNRACVNPAHLEPVTQRENLMRSEGQSAIHARKTHCIHGHEFNEANTYHYHGKRMCIQCRDRRLRDRASLHAASVPLTEPGRRLEDGPELVELPRRANG